MQTFNVYFLHNVIFFEVADPVVGLGHPPPLQKKEHGKETKKGTMEVE